MGPTDYLSTASAATGWWTIYHPIPEGELRGTFCGIRKCKNRTSYQSLCLILDGRVAVCEECFQKYFAEQSAIEHRPSWDTHFIRMAVLTAMRSRDPSTKCGAVIVDSDNIVVSTGYNGFPRDFNDYDDQLWINRDEKYKRIIHAEANAILNAVRHGRSVDGCTLYVTWMPCEKCALMIIQSGIKKVVMLDDPSSDTTWGFDTASMLFNENNVETMVVPFVPITLNRMIRGEIL